MDNRRAAHFWLLTTSLNTARFAIAELEPKKMGFTAKHHFNKLRNSINGFLTDMQAKSTKQDKQLLEEMSFENVIAMSETMAMIAQIPEPQIEWFLSQVNKLTYAAVNRELSNQKTEVNEH